MAPHTLPYGRRTWRLMTALAEAGRPMLTTELLPHAGVERYSQQQGLTKIGNIMRWQLKRGGVRKAGMSKGSWQRCPIQYWEITGAGREMLQRSAGRMQAKIDAAAARDARAEALARIRAEAAGGFTIHDRHTAANYLRSLGCTYRSIADIFGVTPETIRLDTVLPERTGRHGRPAREHGFHIRGPQQGRRTTAMHWINDHSMMAGMLDVTFTEWW